MTVKLKPETAAKFAAELFPDSDASESLEKLIDWLTVFSLKHQEIRDSAIQRSQVITQGEDAISSIDTQKPRNRHRNNSKAREMIQELFAYANEMAACRTAVVSLKLKRFLNKSKKNILLPGFLPVPKSCSQSAKAMILLGIFGRISNQALPVPGSSNWV